MKALFLNGPKASGKDTVGNILAKFYASPAKFTWPMDTFFHATLGYPEDYEWLEIREKNKDQPLELFGGKSLRQAMIAFSEEFMKPQFGSDIFGKLLVQMMKSYANHPNIFWVITDSGFEAEANPVIDYIGAENCYLVRLHRAGCDFKGDSRGYWTSTRIRSTDYQNAGTLADLREDFVWAFKNTLRAAGWGGPFPENPADRAKVLAMISEPNPAA